MDNKIELVVLRRVAGHKPGELVTVCPDDERWASHILAGNAAALGEVAAAVQDGLTDEGFAEERLVDEGGIFDGEEQDAYFHDEDEAYD